MNLTLERAGDWLRRLPLGDGARRPLKRLYEMALSARAGGRGLRRELPTGETLFISPAFRHIGWNAVEVDAFRDAVTPGSIALDIGANVGAYALLLGRWVGDSGRVFAFEPSPAAEAGLREHLRLNDLDRRVVAVPSAVGGVVGALPFVIEPTAGEGRLAASPAAHTITVPVTTVDAFCAEQGITPNFIKVDVEGAELDVLTGARDTIARTKGRLALFVELHPSVWPERGLARETIERAIERLGLRVESLVAGVDPWTLEGVTARLVVR